MAGNKRKIDLWLVLHGPDSLKSKMREVSLSIHSRLIIGEARPTKISGSNSIRMKGQEDFFLVHLEVEADVPLFIHVVAVIDATTKNLSTEAGHYISYRNVQIESNFPQRELIIELSDFHLYSLCRPVLASGYAA